MTSKYRGPVGGLLYEERLKVFRAYTQELLKDEGFSCGTTLEELCKLPGVELDFEDVEDLIMGLQDDQACEAEMARFTTNFDQVPVGDFVVEAEVVDAVEEDPRDAQLFEMILDAQKAEFLVRGMAVIWNKLTFEKSLQIEAMLGGPTFLNAFNELHNLLTKEQ